MALIFYLREELYFCLFVLELKPILFINCVQYICMCDVLVFCYEVYVFVSTQSLWLLSYGLNDPGFESRKGQGIFLFSKNAHADSVAHVASCSMCIMTSFLGVKRPESEVDHSHYIVPMLRMSGSMPPLLLHTFTVCTDTILLLMCDVSFFYFVPRQ